MSPSTLQLQDSFLQFHSRRLLLHTPLYNPPPVATIGAIGNEQQPDSYTSRGNSIDANVVMVLAVLLCALICSLALNSIIKFVLWCTGLLPSRTNILINSRTTLPQIGITKKALKAFPTISYSPEVVNQSGLDTECAICLSEFTTGERIRILPKCNHGFHVRCIDKWLNSHPSCPTCRHCLIDVSKKKMMGCNQVGMVAPAPLPPPSETMIILCPLEPEVMIRNYRGI
ncbi:RING-H2 finger protein ATL78-like [Impatiens glandulifera]|uniref:RING-H2 finger protein ATL78-like n=1 Tax=Impatiens glandulifera TaxID=253017 RepID=UPI001FB17628|nr:RING-H2 finger protein ATL78-like [Impatiens glandulifera]